MTRRLIVAVVICATTIIGGLSAPAAGEGDLVPVDVGVDLPELTLAAAAPGTVSKSCSMNSHANFEGVRDLQTNIISGNWNWIHSTYCEGTPNGYMAYLLTYGYTFYNGARSGPPTVDDECTGGTVNPQSCYGVISGRFFGCVYCNGHWRFESHHRLELPAPLVWTSWPPECTRHPNAFWRIDCTLNAQTTLS